MKLFFALWPDTPTRQRLHLMQTRLLPLTGGRGTSPDTFHLTLCFLDSIDPDRMNSLTAIGSEISGKAFEMQIDTVQCFEKARVGWAGSTQIPQALLKLQTSIQYDVGAEGFDADPSPFRPHITVMRHLPKPFETISIKEIPWAVRDFSLVASLPDATTGGVRYKVLKTWALRG